MLGETIFKIEHDDDFIKFYTFNGLWEMYHDQDCCETVTIDDINGDLDDLIGYPITLCEESTSNGDDEGEDDYYESITWTFYRFATIKGYVNIKWFGTSNGYYSESVNFEKSEKDISDIIRDYKINNILTK